MVIKNKKGFLRILEAFIAIILIAGVLGFFYVNNAQKQNKNEVGQNLARIILEEIANDNNLRGIILADTAGTDAEIDLKISELIEKSGGGYKYSFKICELNEICIPDNLPKDKEIISGEISVSATLNEQKFKKITLSLWEG